MVDGGGGGVLVMVLMVMVVVVMVVMLEVGAFLLTPLHVDHAYRE